MTTEEMFKFGITPKEGHGAGKKYEVYSLNRTEVFASDENGNRTNFAHGTYKLWEPLKTLFEDDSIKPTWGNLKKAMEARGLSDDTLFISDLTTFDPFALLSPNPHFGARFRVVHQCDRKGDEAAEIMVY